MLGGKLPFSGRTTERITSHITTSIPVSLMRLSPNIPPKLNELIIDGCLAKQPKNRPTILEVGETLRKFGGDGDVTAITSTKIKQKSKWHFWR